MGKPKVVLFYRFSVIIIIVSTIMTCLGAGNVTVRCFEKERLALLKFKHSVKDYNNRLSSWVGSDCCKWFGVGCDGVTGHVVSLHLRSISWDGIDFHSRHDFYDEQFSKDVDSLDAGSLVGSELNSALAELRYMKYMDLSSNDFQFSEIPEFIGSLKQLRFLNLSRANFGGNIPRHLGNLSNLNVLDLGFNSLMADDFTWLSALSFLKHLDLSQLEFSQTHNLDKLLNLNMPSLVELHLSQSENLKVQVDPSRLNSSSMLANIQLLDLSWCYSGDNSFPSFLRNMTSLVSLDLSNYDLSQPHSFEILLNIAPFVSELHVSSCNLQNTDLSRIHVNTSKHSNIQYLDLSGNIIFGEFPHFLLNMSSLSSLDLSDNFLNSWVPVMSGLLTLKLSYNNYSHIELWKQCHLKLLRVDHNHIQREMIGPSTNISQCSQYAMEVLDLSWNELNCLQIPESFGKFKALKELNLAHNQLMGPIPISLGKLTALKVLYLNANQLTGFIPLSLGKLIYLEMLSLECNNLTGPIPASLGRLASLRKFSVSSNLLNGTITSSKGQLTKLIYLDVSNNFLEGVVSETHFVKLSNLKYFFASFNPKLSFNISRDWIPPFQLTIIRLNSCNISSEFPWWLRTQTKLRVLAMSNSSISGYLPKWLQKMSMFQLLDLSHNQLSGPLTNLPTSKPLTGFGFTYYRGSMFLKNNFFSGPIPETLCKWRHLEVLDLSKNRLSGKIPRCLGNLVNLKAMIFNSNELSGIISNFLGNMSYSLTWLNLNNNSLSGELPISLEIFYDLRVLDLGDNQLSGSIPKWIGDHLYHLVVLKLHKNYFSGSIPRSLCRKDALQILDIAQNNITGEIPRCFNKLSGMIRGSVESIHNGTYDSNLNIHQVIKGVDLEYTTTLQFVVNMDLSSNKLVGKIPDELTTLAMLVGLNLSHNNLSGGIPDSIGNMKALNSLDLSVNKLTGMIPPSMASLTFLSYLNLSNNNLSGRIPTGNQLQTLGDPSIYAGNRDLCGAPLLKNCSNNEDHTTTSNGKYEEVDEPKRVWFYLDIACGFATGFGGVIGVLLLKKRWRHKLYMFYEVVMDKIHVAVAVRVARMKRGREPL